MLRLSKLTDYAIMLLTTMAEDSDAIASASELSSRTRLEQPTVSKILKQLARAGVILSFRGAHGGYRLAEPPEQLSVSAVIAAMEGPIGMTECAVEPGACAQEAYCSVQSNWRIISQTIENALANVTLADMARRIAPPEKRDRLSVVTLTG